MTAHTPTPWASQLSAGEHQGLIYEVATGRTIALVYDVKDMPIIERAVNAHDELVAALTNIALQANDLAKELDMNSDAHSYAIGIRDDARAALAKVEGK